MPTDYYSLLRIPSNASKLDIINAYRHAKLTFRKDALAVYSLYSEEELTEIRLEVDKAYAILSDREKRQVYDAEHGYAPVSIGQEDAGQQAYGRSVAEQKTEAEELEQLRSAERRLADDIESADRDAAADEAGKEKPEDAPGGPGKRWGDNVVHLHQRKQRDYDPDLERRIENAEEFSGSLLREVREYRGVELQDVAEHTRISISYLRAIEEEDTASLPARAYLKGYIGQYAAEIDLEPHRVVQGYPPLSAEHSGI